MEMLLFWLQKSHHHTTLATLSPIRQRKTTTGREIARMFQAAIAVMSSLYSMHATEIIDGCMLMSHKLMSCAKIQLKKENSKRHKTAVKNWPINFNCI